MSMRTSLGSHSVAGGTKLPNPPWSFLWIPGSSLPVLGGEDSQTVKWCAVGPHESAKCSEWTYMSGGILKCTTKQITEDCIAAIVVRKALSPQLSSDTHTCGSSAETSQIPPHQP